MYIFTSLPLVHDDRTNSLSLLFFFASSFSLRPLSLASLYPSRRRRSLLSLPPVTGGREGDEEGRLPPSLSLSFPSLAAIRLHAVADRELRGGRAGRRRMMRRTGWPTASDGWLTARELCRFLSLSLSKHRSRARWPTTSKGWLTALSPVAARRIASSPSSPASSTSRRHRPRAADLAPSWADLCPPPLGQIGMERRQSPTIGGGRRQRRSRWWRGEGWNGTNEGRGRCLQAPCLAPTDPAWLLARAPSRGACRAATPVE